MMKPLFLVSNDDGIQSIGLEILVEHLGQLGDVIVAAPDGERSAIGHGISLSHPLRTVQWAPNQHAISGTPADCVLLGLMEFCPRRPDLVISGINLGLNLGTDVFYSGTLAAALEGAIRGITAVAVSQEVPSLRSFEYQQTMKNIIPERLGRTAHFACQVIQEIIETPLPPSSVLSINAPLAPGESFVWTCLGRRVYREDMEKRNDLRGVPYYWIGGPVQLTDDQEESDSYAIEHGKISVTPLHLDLTAKIPTSAHHWKLQSEAPVSKKKKSHVSS